MDRINQIRHQKLYQEAYQKIQEYEKNRAFCRHDRQHFLDVARIAMLLNYEEDLKIPKDMIYAAALLHDIGRFLEYAECKDHHEASAKAALCILKSSGFQEDEILPILEAIKAHGDAGIKNEKSFRGIFYRSDKLSRGCFACEAYEECDWPMEKKNREITY